MEFALLRLAMSDQPQPQELAESHLRELIAQNPDDWETRKKLTQLLYNEGKTAQAAEVVWEAPEIPSIDLELGFAIKILGKGAPSKAIRLLTGIQELNEGKAIQNLGLANALMHYGMVMQAARFYGAALAIDPSLASPDLEHFLLWVDDKEKLWGDFEKDKPNLTELPWMKRDAKEAEALKMAMRGHTTPLKIPNLMKVTAEQIIHDMYAQSSYLNAEPSPPPAVTIPIDRVDPKHVLVDPERGAAQPVTSHVAQQSAGPVGGSTGQPLPPAPAPLTPRPLTPPVSQPKPLTPPVSQPKPLTNPAVPAAVPAASELPATQPSLITAPVKPPVVPTVKLSDPGVPSATPLTASPAPGSVNPQPPAPPQQLQPAIPPAAPLNPTVKLAPTVPISPVAPASPPATPSQPTPNPAPLNPVAPSAPPASIVPSPKPLTPTTSSPPAPSSPVSGQPTIPLPKAPATPHENTATPIPPKPAAPKIEPAPMPLPAAKPADLSPDGKIQPIKLQAGGGSGDAPVPLLRPVVSTTLVDGKIVINKPKQDDNK